MSFRQGESSFSTRRVVDFSTASRHFRHVESRFRAQHEGDSGPGRPADSGAGQAADSDTSRATDSRPRRAADSGTGRATDSGPRRAADSDTSRATDSGPRRAADSDTSRASDSGTGRGADSGDAWPAADGERTPIDVTAAAGLAERQAALIAALVAGAPDPPGFDPDRLAATRRAVMRKRASDAAKHWPVLAASLGPRWIATFAAHHTARAPRGGLRDGWDLARALRPELTPDAAVELREREARWRYDGVGPPRARLLGRLRRALTGD